MKIEEMSNKHLLNSINYWIKFLNTKPLEQYYMGNSEYAEDAVECENRYNEQRAEVIQKLIKKLKKEYNKREVKINAGNSIE